MLFAYNVQKIVFCMCGGLGSIFVFRIVNGLKLQHEMGAVACRVPKFSLCMGAAVSLVFIFCQQHMFNLRVYGCLYGALQFAFDMVECCE